MLKSMSPWPPDLKSKMHIEKGKSTETLQKVVDKPLTDRW
jgi:hypothetical protein